jgi:hypothetical protein
VAELADASRLLQLTAADFGLLNPNTGSAPIFRTRRDFELTKKVFAIHPVLVHHLQSGRRSTWPVAYARMFDMTNDSSWFRKASELSTEAVVPLYEGKMVQAYDHRAADVAVNLANLKRAAQPEALSSSEKHDPQRLAGPQYWVERAVAQRFGARPWMLAFKSVTSPTNMRTMIAAVLPESGVGHSMSVLLPPPEQGPRTTALLLAVLNSFSFDWLARQKVQGQNFSWFILEQLPVIPPARFDDPLPAAFTQHVREASLMNGHHPAPTIADFVLPQVLALSYTAHDLAPFARDLGYVDEQGQVLPPIRWDDEDRRRRLAALDALFFWLYGLGADDAAYVLDTFPIVRAQDEARFGRYRTKEEVLALLGLLPAVAV